MVHNIPDITSDIFELREPMTGGQQKIWYSWPGRKLGNHGNHGNHGNSS